MEFGILDDRGNMLTDIELNSLVKEIHSESPTMGVSMVIGKLRMNGYCVSRERVRCALRSADPLTVALRWTGGLSRRQPYSVAGPNSLWHIGRCILVGMHVCCFDIIFYSFTFQQCFCFRLTPQTNSVENCNSWMH